jgi:hypothetical protein
VDLICGKEEINQMLRGKQKPLVVDRQMQRTAASIEEFFQYLVIILMELSYIYFNLGVWDTIRFLKSLKASFYLS